LGKKSVGNASNGIGDTRTRGDSADANVSGQSGIGIGGMRCRCFMTGID